MTIEEFLTSLDFHYVKLWERWQSPDNEWAVKLSYTNGYLYVWVEDASTYKRLDHRWEYCKNFDTVLEMLVGLDYEPAVRLNRLRKLRALIDE